MTIFTRFGNSVRAAALIGIVVAIYAGVGDYSFTNFDDDAYVSENRQVLGGLTLDGMKWAFTTFETGNYHPVTWLSHMIDVSLFGPDPGWFHRVNGLFHAANALLLFLVLARATGETEKSWLVAALFAAHPLHVESVAWISERKDLLAFLFWLLSSWSYLRYVERRGAYRYLPFLFFFGLGLLSKPSVVTLPFALLLMDRWPLKRKEPFLRLVLEKLPIFLLSLASSVTTVIAQRLGGAMAPSGVYPLDVRIENAVVAYVAYLWKSVWPASLSVFYPHPWILGTRWPAWQVAGSAAILIAVTAAVIRSRQTRPYLFTGWFWYLGTLVPMIGLVHVGMQAFADRYTYIPLIGAFIMAAWGGSEAFDRLSIPSRVRAGAVAVLLAALIVPARFQVAHWRDSLTLFGHSLAVNPDNWLAHANVGRVLMREKRLPEAAERFTTAVRIHPRFVEAYFNLGIALYRMGDLQDALRAFEEGLRHEPGSPLAMSYVARINEEMRWTRGNPGVTVDAPNAPR